MANDSSLMGGGDQSDFDLGSQVGVARLLASVRASQLDVSQKNELRDLIFLYINGGRDQSVRLELEQKVAAHSIAPVAVAVPESKPDPETVYPFGLSRKAPEFSVSQARTSTAITPAPQPAAPVAAPTPAPAAVVEPPVMPPAPEPSPAPITPAPQPSTPQPTTLETADTQASADALARIREIKSKVNEKVGNPVNLVDINNEVGREYMAALLDAMKKLNSGVPIASAMDRLEASYQLVEKTLSEHESDIQASVVGPKPVPVQSVPQPPTPDLPRVQSVPVSPPVPPADVSDPTTSTQVTAAQPVTTQRSEPTPLPTTERQPVDVPEPIVSNKVFTPAPPPMSDDPVTQEPPSSPPVPKPSFTPATESFEEQAQSEPASFAPSSPSEQDVASQARKIPIAKIPVTGPQPPVVDQDESDTSRWSGAVDAPIDQKPGVDKKMASLADTNLRLKTPSDLPVSKEPGLTENIGDPLLSREVDEGLQQLLTEWQIFKKSGLFGTGPKGREHPLFLKLANLQIPLILAGRFEGATQEIRQSITDYMNGWRYEQGIIYEPGETFEHYLRRIIRHILDLQKSKKGSYSDR